MAKPPLSIELTWVEKLRFEGVAGPARTAIDGDGVQGASPMCLLLEALASCAASDVVEILRKGRQAPRGLRVRATGERRQEPPHRFTAVRLEFQVAGPVDRDRAERAIRLSLEKYCSVFHTLRPDVGVGWELALEPPRRGAGRRGPATGPGPPPPPRGSR